MIRECSAPLTMRSIWDTCLQKKDIPSPILTRTDPRKDYGTPASSWQGSVGKVRCTNNLYSIPVRQATRPCSMITAIMLSGTITRNKEWNKASSLTRDLPVKKNYRSRSDWKVILKQG